MDKTKRLWLLTFLLVALVVGGGWVGLVSPKADEAGRVRTEAENQQNANRQLQRDIDLLKKQAKDLPKQQARLAEISKKIPSNPALPAFIRALTETTDKTNIEIISLKPEQPKPLPATTGVAPGAATGTGTTGTGTTGTGTTGTGTTGTGTTGTGTGTTAPGSTIAVPSQQILFIPVEIVVQGSYPDMQRLLGAFEEFSRAMLVSGIKIEKAKQAGPGGGNAVPTVRTVGTRLEMTVTGRLFMTTAPATSGLTPKSAPTSAASK